MIAPNVQAQILSDVRGQFDVVPSSGERFVVYLPFVFSDGDQFPVIVQRDDRGWYVTDDGATHSYLRDSGVPFSGSQRQELIATCLAEHGVEAVGGELQRRILGEDWSDAIFALIQAIDQMVTVRHLTRERIANTFAEDVFSAIREASPAAKIDRGWHDESVDPDKLYPIDFHVSSDVPIFIFAGTTTQRCVEAALTVRTYKDAEYPPFRSLAILSGEAVSQRSRGQLSHAGVPFFHASDKAMMVPIIRQHLGPSPN